MPARKKQTTTRLPMLIVGLAACFWGAWTSAREGAAQLIAGQSMMTEQVSDADRAVLCGPRVPEAHYARANLLALNHHADAVREYERAVLSRSKDYALWFELARARDLAGDSNGAIAAFTETINLAPFYAKPHWQLGNVLYRAGRTAEALTELRLAATSDPKLTPPVLALMWPALNANVEAVDKALSPRSATMQLALARFLVKQGKIADAMRQFRDAGGITNAERRALLTELLARKSYAEAFEVWSTRLEEERIAGAFIENGGFEEPISLDEPGFGWQFTHPKQAVQISLDPDQPRSGAYSMRIDWDGNSDPNAVAASQLVLVRSGMRYRLTFSARTNELTTIGLPTVAVIDLTSEPEAPLGKAVALPGGSTGWQNYSTEFATGDQTRAVRITIARAQCQTQPCPAFGNAWYDDFSVIELR